MQGSDATFSTLRLASSMLPYHRVAENRAAGRRRWVRRYLEGSRQRPNRLCENHASISRRRCRGGTQGIFSWLLNNGSGLTYIQQFGREALIWRQLCHPNLLPFFGVYYTEKRLCLVSPWMESGNVMQYLRKQSPDINRCLSLVGLS